MLSTTLILNFNNIYIYLFSKIVKRTKLMFCILFKINQEMVADNSNILILIEMIVERV